MQIVKKSNQLAENKDLIFNISLERFIFVKQCSHRTEAGAIICWTYPSLSSQTALQHFYCSPSCSRGTAARYLKAEGQSKRAELNDGTGSLTGSCECRRRLQQEARDSERLSARRAGRRCSKAQIETDHCLYRLLPQSVACSSQVYQILWHQSEVITS